MSFFGEIFGHWGIYVLKKGNPWQIFKNHSQLLIIFILLSFLLLSHHFKVHRVDIWLYWGFLMMRWGYLGKVLAIEIDMYHNRGIPDKTLKITHNYLIFLFYYHFLLHFFIISKSTDLRLNYIEVFWVIGEFLWEKYLLLGKLIPETG